MIILWLYAAIMLVALLWVSVDGAASGAFEILRSNNRESARQMGVYSEFLRYSLGRLALLTTLVALSCVAACVAFVRNPLGYGTATSGTLLFAMLTGSLLLLALPRLADCVRFFRFLYASTTQLAELVAVAESESEIRRRWDAAEYETSRGWTAWRPSIEEYENNPLWSDEMDPDIYVRRENGLSVCISFHFGSFFGYFLSWKLPNDVEPGDYLPFSGLGGCRFLVKRIYKIVGRDGWSLVNAKLDLDGVDTAA
ncbi:MAG: hypothetical protein AAF961_10920 [Planctomycetota bacterium]